MSLKSKLHTYATQTLGFDDCRFCQIDTNDSMNVYTQWIQNGFHGQMDYLKNHSKFKENPELLCPNAKSAIVVIVNYKNTKEKRLKNLLKISRYAVGMDYHSVIKEKLNALSGFLKAEEPGVSCYAGVDSSPIAERSLALKSGVGFLGKNTAVIKPGLGSYFFIGCILTSCDLKDDKPLMKNCGQCRLCIDACPTQAILSDCTLNANRCLSYQTIEKKTSMTDEEIKNSEGWLFGCDICQEVCPYNSDSVPLTTWKEFLPDSGVGFGFFEENSPDKTMIPKPTPLYRSRKRLLENWKRFVSLR